MTLVPSPVVIRRVATISSSVGLTVVLLSLLWHQTDFSTEQTLEVLLNIGPTLLTGIVLASTLQMLVGAAKWRMVSEKMLPRSSSQAGAGFFFFYSSVGAVLSQVLPAHLSSAAARGAAVKLHYGDSGLKGAISSVYEQGFDLVVPALLVPASVCCLVNDAGLHAWLATALAVVVLTALTLGIAGSRLVGLIQRWLDILGADILFLRPVGRLLASGRKLNLFENRFLLKIFVLAVARYTAHVARAVLVSCAVGLDIAPSDIVMIVPLVQLALIVALTPGSLGISEWSWVGLLVLTGTSLESAGLFAVTHRILMFASLLVTFLLSALAYAAERQLGARALQPVCRADEVGRQISRSASGSVRTVSPGPKGPDKIS